MRKQADMLMVDSRKVISARYILGFTIVVTALCGSSGVLFGAPTEIIAERVMGMLSLGAGLTYVAWSRARQS